MAEDRVRRRRNPEQTRNAIIDALLELLKAGQFAPTTKDIAARAATSERSIFVHFPGRDDLTIAAVDRQSEAVESLIETVSPELPLEQRVESAVRQSAAIFALQRHPRVLGLLGSQVLPAMDIRMRLTDRRIRESLRRSFAPEVDGDEELLDTVDATLGWPFRQHLVERLGRSEAEASAAVRRTLLGLLR
ncbi:helix-turn-helix domain-containing protein [Nocardia sp. NPDC050710]|uniref:TetR/AcrR family transcriptional regulator n=1 Tax=Nocardia sp. NPDC050710 TaxID=3157220 RepID=UPI0033D1B35F